MTTPLPSVNLTAAEMVPDTVTPGHDPNFWCLPPTHYNPNTVESAGGGYEYHLVTRGRKVGIWRNWTSAQAMVSGFPNSAHKGHHTYAACKEEWQQHCRLGVHPHPPAPATPPAAPTAGAGLFSSPSLLWPPSRQPPAPAANVVPSVVPSSISTPSSLTTSSTASSGRSHPRRSTSAPGTATRGRAGHGPLEGRGEIQTRYYAIWGGGVVFSTREAAKRDFDEAVEGGEEPKLLSTGDFDLALGYAEGRVM